MILIKDINGCMCHCRKLIVLKKDVHTPFTLSKESLDESKIRNGHFQLVGKCNNENGVFESIVPAKLAR